MLVAQVVINKVWDIIPEHAKETWHELPVDIDTHVAHDFFRDVLKPGLIRMYQSFAAQLKEDVKTMSPIEMSSIFSCQSTILEGLGLIEVYFSEFTSN